MTRSLAAALILFATAVQADGPVQQPAISEQAMQEETRGGSFPAETMVTLAVVAIIAMAFVPDK